jgi:hypothetical protein
MKDLAPITSTQLLKRPGHAVEAAVLDSVWLHTTDHGPYAFDGKPPWMKEILQGDILDAVRQVRALSWGGKGRTMEIERRCRGVLCGVEMTIEVDVLEDLPITPLSEEGRAVLADGNCMDYTMPDGTRLVYELPTGRTAILAERWAQEYGAAQHVVLAARLRQVEGVQSPSKFPAWLGELEGEDGLALEEELDRLNCGVETTISVVCEKCETEQEVIVPIAIDFFMPPRKGRGRHRGSLLRTATDDE